MSFISEGNIEVLSRVLIGCDLWSTFGREVEVQRLGGKQIGVIFVASMLYY